MSELEAKRTRAEKLRQEIRDMEDKERLEKELPVWKSREGTFWKFKNCYSCPQGDKDYWWAYRQISNVTAEGLMDLLEFQIDKDGRLNVKEWKQVPWLMQTPGWIEATEGEWHEAARIAQAITAKLLF